MSQEKITKINNSNNSKTGEAAKTIASLKEKTEGQ